VGQDFQGVELHWPRNQVHDCDHNAGRTRIIKIARKVTENHHYHHHRGHHYQPHGRSHPGLLYLHGFSEFNQQDATFLNLFFSVRRSTCFRRVFRPSSGAQNRTYSVRHLSDHYCYLLLAVQASSS